MSDAMFMELMAVVGLANQTNRLSDGLRMQVGSAVHSPGRMTRLPSGLTR
jgi:hypothetical protein